MPKNFTLARMAVVTFGVLVAPHALADVLTLKNGDRITGTLVRKADSMLTFKTSYAGELKIKWADVASLSTERPVEVQLADGSNFNSRLATDTPDRVVLETRTGAAESSLPLERIAFINPTPDQSGKGVLYKRRVNLAANVVRGNTDSGRVVAEGEFVARARSYRYRFWGQGTRASEGGDTTESNWRTTASYDWFFRPKEFYYGRMSFEQDRFRDIRLRSQFGVGYGYQFVETTDTELSVQAGPDFVHVNPYDGPADAFAAAAWGIHYSQWLGSRAAQVYIDQSGFWNLQTTSDVVTHTNAGVRVPLSDGLQATMQVKVDWDTDPEPGTKSADTTVLLGLGYAW